MHSLLKHLRIERKHGIDWIGRRRGRRRHAHSEIGPKDYVVERGQRLNHRFYVKNGKYLFASLPCVCVCFIHQARAAPGKGEGTGGERRKLCVFRDGEDGRINRPKLFNI